MDVVKIDIWGTCISRDSFGIPSEGDLPNDLQIVVSNYYQGASPLVQYTNHSGPDLFSNELPSSIHNAGKKWVLADYDKSILDTLKNSDSEWLIVDFRSM
ncbi:MAG: hypothetical protein IKA33_03125, partial [Candidatus Methanomethylophilaceae archaeon]|nr:hypothetical protein [Candidatus Methanomethylophilaceae archaeon]